MSSRSRTTSGGSEHPLARQSFERESGPWLARAVCPLAHLRSRIRDAVASLLRRAAFRTRGRTEQQSLGIGTEPAGVRVDLEEVDPRRSARADEAPDLPVLLPAG